jgi:hypothetical protein
MQSLLPEADLQIQVGQLKEDIILFNTLDDRLDSSSNLSYQDIYRLTH